MEEQFLRGKMKLTYENTLFWYMSRKKNIQKTEVFIYTNTLSHLFHASILET